MKLTALILFVTITLSGAKSFAQERIDVLYLRNGSVIYGSIIEQIVGESIKIQTRDGNVLAFRMEEIEKINRVEERRDLQDHHTQPVQPEPLKSRFGLQIGSFAIALDNFEKIYGSSSSFTFGTEGQWLFSRQFGLSTRFRYFSKKGQLVTITSGGATASNPTVEWTEYWLVLGMKAYFETPGIVAPFLGAGVGYFSVKEAGSVTFDYGGSQETISASVSKDAWGLALFGGANILLSSSIYLVLEAEFTSASIKGGEGLGGTDAKVGGLFIDGGLEFAF